MPDPVCLTASIISLISASAKLSLTFYQVADVIISSKEDISTLAAEISIFSQCLSMFGRAVEQSVSKIEGFKEIAEKLIESTRDVIIELAKVINNIAPRWLSEDPERRLPFVGRLKWLFSKSKVIALRNNVESLKTTLLTLISVVEYTESRKNDSSEDMQHLLGLKAESLLRTSRTSDSRCAIIEGPSGNALPLLVESVSQADETFTQDNSAATRLTYDIVALPDSDGTLEVDMEVPSELEEAVLTTGQLIRMLKLKREPNINPSPPISTLECRDLVLAFGLATLPPPSSIQYWSWSDMTVQKQPKMEQVIYFVDDFEREFTFPLSEVKTWQEMEALIKQVMKGMPLVGDSIEKGYYDVRGPDGKCIIPQYWNASVRPATKVTLKTFLLNSDYIALMSYKENYKRRAIDE